MGARLRENPDKIFEVFTEIAAPNEDGSEAFVLQQYPQGYSDEEVLKTIPQFAFPCKTEASAVDHFTFVLTDIDGKFRFGFCRHTSGAQTCLCIISCLPWYEVFYKLLNYLAEVLNRNENNSVAPLLRTLHEQQMPSAGAPVEVVTPSLHEKFAFVAPNDHQLPSIPENRNLTEYYNAVDATNMMVIFASLLYERRILITSRKLSRLTACIHAAATLLYPMCWQHLYIPVLPQHLKDYCSAPMPYMIGVHSSIMESVKNHDVGDAVVLDADANTVHSEYDDLATLPSDIVSSLKKRLKAQQSDKMSSNLMGDGVARAFLKAMVALIGGYRDALRFRPGEQITFDPDAFILSRPSYMQPFLQKMLQLQIFEQFINDRLDILNAGEGFTDEFELEANLWADKWGTQSRYRDWSNNMKKQGKKFKRESKDKWVEFTSKANPAVRHAMQTVRDRSRKTFKDIRSKIEELRKDEEEADISFSRKSQKALSPTHPPPRPPPPDLGNALGPTPTPRQSVLRRTAHEKILGLQRGSRRGFHLPHSPFRASPVMLGARHYKVISVDDDEVDDIRSTKRISSDDSEVIDLSMKRVSTDLMGDPDIQNVFKKSYSLEDLTVPLEGEEDEEEELAETSSCVLEIGKNALDVTYGPDSSTNSSTSPAYLKVRREPSPLLHAPTLPPPTAVTPPLSASTGDLMEIKPLPRPAPSPHLRRGTATSHSSSDLLRPQSNGPSDPSKRHTVYGGGPLDASLDLIQLDLSAASLTRTKSSGLDSSSTDDTSSLEFDPLRDSSSVHSADFDNSRSRVSRHNAFYNAQRPPSLRRKSQATDAQTIKEARTTFMQTEAAKTSIQKSSPSTEQFDPLLTGQLAVDAPSNNKASSPEENLLKEWNLDFTKMRMGGGSLGRPQVPPRPLPRAFPPPSHQTIGPNYPNAPHIGFWTAPRGHAPPPKSHTLGPHVSSIMGRLNTAQQPACPPPHPQGASPAVAKVACQDPFSDLLDMNSVNQSPPVAASSARNPLLPQPPAMTSTPIPAVRHSKQQQQSSQKAKWETFD